MDSGADKKKVEIKPYILCFLLLTTTTLGVKIFRQQEIRKEGKDTDVLQNKKAYRGDCSL